jgi:outer membrane protein TolC
MKVGQKNLLTLVINIYRNLLKHMKPLLTYFLLFSTILQAQEVKQLSLFDCQKLARENHPYYQDRQRIELNASLKNKNINTQWLPQINANAQATYQSDVTSIPIKIPGMTIPSLPLDQYKLWLDINQMLYDGGSISAQKSINETTSQADLLQNESELHKIVEQVNQNYFTLLLVHENIVLLNSAKDNLIERKKTIEAGVKNGILQESDLKNINIELLKNQQQIDELNLSYSAGLRILTELTGKNLNDSTHIELPDTILTDTGAFQRAEIKMLDIQKTGLTHSDKFTYSQRLPKVFAFSQAGYGRPGLNMLKSDFSSYYIIGISLKWNLWDWSKTSRDRQSISLQSDMLESRRQSFEKNLRIMLDNSQAIIKQLEAALVTDSSIVDLRVSVTKLSSVKLDNGTITASDYIIDLNGEIQAKIQLKTHEIQLVQEKVNYLTIKGIL